MKQVNIIVLAVLFMCTTVLSAANVPVTKKNSELSAEIGLLLKNPSFKIKEDIKARITFTLNKNNEIVVLSVDSEDLKIESFIKNRLNYQKVTALTNNAIKEYKVPVRIVQE